MKRIGNDGMLKGATSGHFELAKALRNNLTEAEEKLWNVLSNKKFMGLKFRRQHPVGGFILDFYCHSLKLAIEIDGKIHLVPEVKIHDKERQQIIEDMGISVVRFTNEQIDKNLEQVLHKLNEVIETNKNKSPL
jgi:imidazole glycerol-phosphate synthase subunit HisF